MQIHALQKFLGKTNSQSEGSGRGLAITRKVAKVHGGSIFIKDATRGATVQIVFKLLAEE